MAVPVHRPAGVPGAASLGVRLLLDRSPGTAAVLAAFPSTIYLARHDSPDVLSLVTLDGVRLPNAVVLPTTAAARPFAGIAAGDTSQIGGGQVRVGQLAVMVRRWWSAAVSPREHTIDALARGLAALGEVVRPDPEPLVHALSAAMAEDDRPGLRRIIRELVGRGPGLTPAGDDVLAGFLAALHAFGSCPAGLAREIVALASDRTTALSASLLSHAGRGEAAAPLLELLDAVRGHGQVRPAARRLLRAGYASGIDLAHGVLAAGRAVLAGMPVPPHPAVVLPAPSQPAEVEMVAVASDDMISDGGHTPIA